jgi:hypothetical protein
MRSFGHHLFVAMDMSASWQVYAMYSREAVDAAVASLPLHPSMSETVHEWAEPAKL